MSGNSHEDIGGRDVTRPLHASDAVAASVKHDHAGELGQLDHAHVHDDPEAMHEPFNRDIAVDDEHGHDRHTGHGSERRAHTHEHGDDRRADGALAALFHAFIPFGHGHSHDIGDTAADQAMEVNNEGRRIVAISFGVLGITAALQLTVVVVSGSVGLLADTIHNGADALTAIPLWIAFSLGRRPPNRRYTYGYGRAEDAAGLAVVGIIFISAAVAFWESVQKLMHPQAMDHLPVVAIGALVGFGGNELVAWLRVSAGRRIGSAALVADGKHARADGITSLSVLLAVLGSWLGFPIADPIIGMLITFAIALIGKDAGLMMWRRLMDAIEPELLDSVERAVATVDGVMRVGLVRGRWVGHRIIVDVFIVVDETISVAQGHMIAEDAKHALLHAVPRLADATIHVDPCEHSGVGAHRATAHHTEAT